jgi:hypothetical protein
MEPMRKSLEKTFATIDTNCVRTSAVLKSPILFPIFPIIRRRVLFVGPLEIRVKYSEKVGEGVSVCSPSPPPSIELTQLVIKILGQHVDPLVVLRTVYSDSC